MYVSRLYIVHRRWYVREPNLTTKENKMNEKKNRKVKGKKKNLTVTTSGESFSVGKSPGTRKIVNKFDVKSISHKM